MVNLGLRERLEQHFEDRSLGLTAAMATASRQVLQARSGKMLSSTTPIFIAASRVTSSLQPITQAVTRIPTMATGDLEALLKWLSPISSYRNFRL